MSILKRIIIFITATVWFVNGFFCKMLNLTPRHEQIVYRILQVDGHGASLITLIIGFFEVLMAIWILSGYQKRLNAIIQIAIIAIMNTLEFILAPDLLLWGRLNALFAFLFILMILMNEYYKTSKITLHS